MPLGYERRTVEKVNLETENHGSLEIETAVDSHDAVTITFGHSFTLRIDDENLTHLREMLHKAAVALEQQRPPN
jgi:hypothetical protein